MPEEQRSEQLATLVTPSEAADVRRLADMDQRSISDWIRFVVRKEIAASPKPAGRK